MAELNAEHAAVKIDGTLLEKLAADGSLTPEEKAAQIEAAVVHEIKARPHDPAMQALSEKLQALRERKIAADAQIEKLLEEYEQLVMDLEEHAAAPGKLGLSEAGYALLELVRSRAPGAGEAGTLEIVRRIDERIREVAGFAGWQTRDDVRQAVSKVIIAELAHDPATLDLVVGGFAEDAVGTLVAYAEHEQ